MKYFEVEVTRTVTERRNIYVSAENGDTAHDAAVENAEFVEVKAPWGRCHCQLFNRQDDRNW
jgi:hypothetical protein